MYYLKCVISYVQYFKNRCFLSLNKIHIYIVLSIAVNNKNRSMNINQRQPELAELTKNSCLLL